LLIKTGSDKQELFDQLQQEVAVMHTLSTHPNIVKLLCYTIDPPTIVTPLYAGNLGNLIHAKNQVYTSLDLIHIIYQFLSTMDTIHNRGIAHRDLKPANILLENRVIEHSSTMGSRPRGEWSDFKFRIKIADFGISYVNKDEAPSKMKLVNVLGLSAPYAAPEIFLMLSAKYLRTALDDFQRADVYSFAITIWELIHRSIPWDGLTRQVIEGKVKSGERPAITVNRRDDNKLVFVTAMIPNCWNGNPSGRPLFKDLLRQLRVFMDLESVPYSQVDI